MAPTPSTSSGNSGKRSAVVKGAFMMSPRQICRLRAADGMEEVADKLRHGCSGNVEHRMGIDGEHERQHHERRQNHDLTPAEVFDPCEAGLLQSAEDHFAAQPKRIRGRKDCAERGKGRYPV